MPEHLHYEDDELFNPETHHEKTDVNVRVIIWFAVAFVVFAFVTHAVLYGMYKQFVKMERKSSAAVPVLTEVQRPEDASVPKNQPLLQPFPMKTAKGEAIAPTSNTPVTDLVDMRRREDAALNSYGWVDKQHGVVRIPIAEAKKLALQRGYPTVAQPAVPATTTAPQQPATQMEPAPIPPASVGQPALTRVATGGHQ